VLEKLRRLNKILHKTTRIQRCRTISGDFSDISSNARRESHNLLKPKFLVALIRSRSNRLHSFLEYIRCHSQLIVSSRSLKILEEARRFNNVLRPERRFSSGVAEAISKSFLDVEATVTSRTMRCDATRQDANADATGGVLRS